MSRETHEPRLWLALWKTSWFSTVDALTLIAFTSLFFGGVALLWRSLPAFGRTLAFDFKFGRDRIRFRRGRLRIPRPRLRRFIPSMSITVSQRRRRSACICGDLYIGLPLIWADVSSLSHLFRQAVSVCHRLSILWILLILFSGFYGGNRRQRQLDQNLHPALSPFGIESVRTDAESQWKPLQKQFTALSQQFFWSDFYRGLLRDKFCSVLIGASQQAHG